MDDTKPLAAAASILIAMAVIGLIDNFVVVIAQSGGLWQFHAIRTAMAFPLILALAGLGAGSIRPRRLRAVAGRSFFVSASMVLYFGSLAFLPIADVAAGLFTAPIWVLLISVVFLQERIGPPRAFAALAGFAGVLMVLRPDAGGLDVATLVPVLAGVFYAFGAIATRRWCGEEDTLTLLAAMYLALGGWGVAGMIALGLLGVEAPGGAEGFILRSWVPPAGPFLFWTGVQALGSLVGVWFLIKGYQLGEASFSAVFEYSLLIFVSFWAYVLRGEALDTWSAAGIGLIIVSGIVIALRGRTAAAPARGGGLRS